MVCAAKGMTYSDKTYDGIFYCGGKSNKSNLILYDSLQLKNCNFINNNEEINIDAFEIEMPDLPNVMGKTSVCFDSKQNSFYTLDAREITKLDMNTMDNLKWNSINFLI